ncbi:MAG: MgtC/SapB family protein [Anaerolineae bacterium]|nr:MgtC/SapB family protein [Anaerolineae bacterium]
MEFIDIEQIQVLAFVALAMFLGSVIGYERESANKPAGLRTHMLVAGAAALLVALGDVLIAHFQVDTGRNVIQSDPIRIIEAIITGVSFLGAGTIIYHRSENVVEGLTTAASILLAAGIGMCVALLQFTLAVGVTVLALIILRIIPAIFK